MMKNQPLPELRLPPVPFDLRAATPPDGALRLVVVFSDQEVSAWLPDAPAASAAAVRRAVDAGLFTGASGESYIEAAAGLWLLGLGRSDGFHPDIIAEAFRDAGARMSKLKASGVVVQLSAHLFQVVLDFAARSLPPGGIDVRGRAAVSAGSANPSAADSEPTTSPDYVFAMNARNLVAQLATCLCIGADSMDLFSEARTKRTPWRGPVFWDVPGLSQSELNAALERGALEGRMTNGVRFTASLPGNLFHPGHAETYARSLAQEFGLDIEVFDVPRLEELGCGGILSVGKGSVIPPRMIRLSYRPTEKQGPGHLVLVGKGITFDTGGVSLKPGEGMHEMKYDMCGMAVALHAVALAAARKLPLEVSAFVGIAENMPDGNASKPGDVYTAYNGVTVEIQNTDAEGRLVLGDVLSYAARNAQPALMLDFATLTGACVISLGHEAAGVFTASEDLAARIARAGLESLDRTWRLPHWGAYDPAIKSDTADMRNIGGRPGGSITAMRFLARFVPPEVPWAHFDIAGTAWRDKARGSQPKGATGWGVRFLGHFFEDLLGRTR